MIAGWWGWVRRRIEVLVRKDEVERELDEEIRFHIEMETRQYERSGLSSAEARRRALVEFGGVERFKEEVRDVRGARLVDDLMQDARVAGRSLPKHPAYVAAVMLTLGIGIGGTVAMFGVLDSSVFSALPWSAPEELVAGRSTMNHGARLGPMVSAYDYYDFRDGLSAFEGLGAIAPFPFRATVTGGTSVERVDVVRISSNFFDVLEVQPVAGRSFTHDEGEPGAAPVAVISEGYWTRSFGADPGVVGRTLSVDGVGRTVVGVMPRTARFYVDADVWIPVVRGGSWANSRSAHNWLLVGRLGPGATLRAASAEADALALALAEAHPDSNEGKGLRLTPLRSVLLEPYQDTLRLLAGAVLLLLVVACANVAGLLLARGQARMGEMAVRSVMGAGTGRLLRQLATENAILALGAAVVGVILGVWMQGAILEFLSMDRIGELRGGLSTGSTVAALATAAATLMLIGITPSLRVARTDASAHLRGGDRVVGRAGSRLRGALVVAQVALTVVLLSVAGLLARSVQELRAVDLGFDPGSLLTADVQLPADGSTVVDRTAFFDALRDGVAALPGVRGVALSTRLPVRDPGDNWDVRAVDGSPADQAPSMSAHQRTVAPGYFTAMGVPLVAGRAPTAGDASAQPAPVVLSESVADRLFGGAAQAVGRAVTLGGRDPEVEYEVIGVVGDVVVNQPRFGRSAAMYFAFHAAGGYHPDAPRLMRLAVRYEGDPARVAAGIRDVVSGLDRSIPVDRVETMEAVLARASADQRALAVLVGGFSAVALLLAAVGLYGVMAYRVALKRREIGIRMAMGASVRVVSGSIVREGLRLVGIGLLIGIPSAWAVTRALDSVLFGVRSVDPATLVGVVAFLGLIGGAACVLPARRAAVVDPVLAFRSE